jgi:hypothetical protein
MYGAILLLGPSRQQRRLHTRLPMFPCLLFPLILSELIGKLAQLH